MTLDQAEASLWEETQEDWHMNYSVGLTEPVCAFISIFPDKGSEYPATKGYIGNHRGDPSKDMVDAICHHLEKIRAFKASRPSGGVTRG